MSSTTRSLGALVLSTGRSSRLRAGETLFNEGDPSTAVYACRSGRLKVTLSTPTGDELVLGWKEPGDGFGELSAIDGGPRSARVSAVVDSELAVLGRSELLDALRRAPDLAVDVLVELSAHLRRSNERIGARRADRAAVRVAGRLLTVGAQLRRHNGGDAPVDVTITQDDLAGWVGATRESTARALAALRRDGIVETGRGRIRILDLAALERMVAGERA